MAKTQLILNLLTLFQQYGYDGATLAKISKATGLGKASLYHYFPGGKDEMVQAVLDYLEQTNETYILQPLRGDEPPQIRFEKMCEGIRQLFDEGKRPCVFAVLLMGSSRTVFHDKIEELLRSWVSAIADVLVAEGIDATLAMQRGEDAVIMIEGALILCQGFNNVAPFDRIMSQLPQQLCQDLPVLGRSADTYQNPNSVGTQQEMNTDSQ